MKESLSDISISVQTERAIRDRLTIGIDLRKAGRFADALRHYAKLAEDIDCCRPILKGKFNHGLGVLHKVIGITTHSEEDLHTAISKYSWAQFFYEEAREPSLAMGSEANIGNVLLFLGRVDEALPYIERAEGYFTRMGEQMELSQVEEIKTRALIQKCEYELAHKYAVQCVGRIQHGVEQDPLTEARATLTLADERLHKAEPIRLALIEEGSVSGAAKSLGLTHQGLNFIINTKYPELKQIKVDGRGSRRNTEREARAVDL